MDRALLTLLEDSEIEHSTLVAVGGYGRGELSPHSDIDLLVVSAKKAAPSSDQLRGLLYPLWDAGFQVGHATLTPPQTIDRAARDLDAATSLLTARRVAGDPELFEELNDRLHRWITKDVKKLVRRIGDALTERARERDRAGWSLAPDIKEDVGGLRDAHTVGWLSYLTSVVTSASTYAVPDRIVQSAELLMGVREALHGHVRRKSDKIRIDLQPEIAQDLDLEDADDLMARVHRAARAVEFDARVHAESITEELLGGPRRSGSTRRLGAGLRVDDGMLDVDGPQNVTTALRLLAHRAHSGRRVSRRALTALTETFSDGKDARPIERWEPSTLESFLDILKGPHSTEALELMEHTGGWSKLLPEWNGIRGRAQHDLYHRYTVDGHSFVVVNEIGKVIEQDVLASSAAAEAGKLDALYVAALLHDVGKGSGEDHSVAGERIARAACHRMGFGPADVDEIAHLVRWHLLLADTATRRDLDDGAVIDAVAKTVAEGRRLRLLYVLTVADGLATGPDAWSAWKAALVRELYRKALVALETGEVPARSDVAARARELEAYEPSLAGRMEPVLGSLPPSYLESAPVPDMVDELRLLLQTPKSGEIAMRIDAGAESGQSVVTICTADRPGTLARSAGVLALHRISVLRAQAYSTSDGYALERFIVSSADQTTWEGFDRDLRAAYSGRLALEAQLVRKIRDYRPEGLVTADVSVVEDASDHSTVVEVRAPDALGLLYAIASGLTDLELDIHVAKIDTLGHRVVDVFYVRTLWGTRLDEAQAEAVQSAVAHRVRRLFG
jgi:[protein-PII] uridylyltransferase